MSIFDTLKYPISDLPTEQELENLPEPIYRLLMELASEEFTILRKPSKGENIHRYWPPKNFIRWLVTTDSRTPNSKAIYRQTRYSQLIIKVRKAIAELP